MQTHTHRRQWANYDRDCHRVTSTSTTTTTAKAVKNIGHFTQLNRLWSWSSSDSVKVVRTRTYNLERNI